MAPLSLFELVAGAGFSGVISRSGLQYSGLPSSNFLVVAKSIFFRASATVSELSPDGIMADVVFVSHYIHNILVYFIGYMFFKELDNFILSSF